MTIDNLGIKIDGRLPTDQVIEGLGRRTEQPTLKTFYEYLSQSRLDCNNLPKTGINIEKVSQLFSFYHHSDSTLLKDSWASVGISDSERKVISSFLADQTRTANLYFGNLISQSPHIQEMLGTLAFLFTPQRKGERANYSYQQAEMMAKRDLSYFYGNNFETRIKTDPNIRNTYIRQIQKYENSDDPFSSKDNLPTIEEIAPILKATIAHQKKALLVDFVKDGGTVDILFVDENNNGGQIDPVKSGRPVTVDETERMVLKDESILGNRYIFTLDGRECRLYCHNKVQDIKQKHPKNTFIPDAWGMYEILADNLKNRDVLDPRVISNYFSLQMRQNMIGLLTSVHNGLIHNKSGMDFSKPIDQITLNEFYGAHGTKDDISADLMRDYLHYGEKKYQTTPLEDYNPMKWSSFLMDIFQGITSNPALLSGYGDLKNLVNPENTVTNFNDSTVTNYFKLRTLLAIDRPITLDQLPFSIGTIKPGLLDMIRTMTTSGNTSVGDFLNDLRKQQDIFHKDAEVSPNVAGLTEVLTSMLRLYVQPDFIISGHPWRHMRALQEVKELSTYTTDSASEFHNYIQPTDCDLDNQLLVSANATIESGKDSDGVEATKIYLPEFSKLTSLVVLDESGKIPISDKAYSIQYEDHSGHYRIVWSAAAKVLFESWPPVIRYQAKINPDQKADGAPKLAKYFEVKDISKVNQFASQLQQHGFLKMADELENLSLKFDKTGKPITSKDLERALKLGARYAFKNSDDNNLDSQYSLNESQFAYLPSPNNEGLATIQCTHAAKLLSELLSEAIPDGSFYPSNMLNTINLGIGVVFAGLPHSDLRGRSGNTRIRHDSTPDIKARSLTELLGYEDKFAKDNTTAMAAPETENAEIIKEMEKTVAILEFNRVCESSFTNFEKQVKLLTPRNPATMQVPVHYQYPSAVREVGAVLASLTNLHNEILTDSTKRRELLEKLAKTRSIWELINNDTNQEKTVQKAKNQLFGIFAPYSETFINALDEVEKAVKNIEAFY